ncbi:MAG: DMT family transporter [Chloroflexi bacterium]|nr:DMT family transporter [Chloroflexota bacterium]
MTFHLGRGERWAIVAAISYTIVNVMLRAASVSVDPYVGSVLRQIPVAMLAFGAIVIGRRCDLIPGDSTFIGWRFVAALFAGGFLSFFVGNVMYFGGLTEGSLGITVSGVQGGVVFAGVLLGIALLGEQPRREQWLGAAVIAAGLVFVAIAQLGTPRDRWWLGLMFAILAGACYASTNVVTRMVQRVRPVLFVVLAGTSLGGLVPLTLVIVAQAMTSGGAAFRTLEWSAVGIVLLAGAFNALALVGLTQAMRDTTVATTNTLSSSQLVFSFFASVLLFSETGSPEMLLGVVLVMAGIVWAQVDRSRTARGPAGDARQ